MGFIKIKFIRDIAGVAWLSLGLFLTLSIVSFNPIDPSFNSAGAGKIASNFCGYAGSFLADILLQGIGVAAWLLAAGAFRMSFFSFRDGVLKPTRSALIAFIVLIITVSSLLGLHFETTTLYSGEIAIGGLVGTVVSKGLITVFNKIGAGVLLWAISLVFIVHYSQKPLVEFIKKPLQTIKVLFLGSRERLVQALKRAFVRAPKQETSTVQKEQVKASFPIIETIKNKGISEAEHLIKEERALVEQETKEDEEFNEKENLVARALNKIELGKKDLNKTRELLKKVSRRIENWELPKISMLEPPETNGFKVDQKLIARNTQLLEDKLGQFNIKGQVVGVRPGPAVTMFEFKPAADVKVSRINDFADDISLALSSESVRIIAPLPGRDVVGIETSNPKREMVFLRETLEDHNFWDDKTKLPIALGKQANGETRVVDLRRMPHMLVAGTTGSGKSVFVVSAITGLIFKHSPKTLRLILVDPKQVDLAVFNNIPHLLMPPIREAKKAVTALKWAIREMDKRYRSMSKFGARGIEAFNETVNNLSKSDLDRYNEEVQMLEESAPHEAYYCQELPYIVIVVEEFGDLMAVDKQNVEQAVVRLAQMARACGIHLVLAMQSPRKDVVTGLIKTNIPGRISFKVASKMDSRIILDDSGAERLLANGDMLFLAPGIGKPERHHGPWIPESDIQAVTNFWSDQAEPDFDKSAMKMLDGSGGGYDFGNDNDDSMIDESEQDEMYDKIVADIAGTKEVSASLLQRRYKLGYPRAARIIEIFEKQGIVGPANGSKPRQVLINKL